MTQLPARDLADVQLARHLEVEGCPVCGARERSVGRYLDAWLWEGVNDVRRRAELDAARGLCGPHTHALLAADRGRGGGQLGTAILLDAILKIRLPELRAAHEARGRGRGKRLESAARPPACPVCRESAVATSGAIAGIGGHLGDTAWAEATAEAAFCLAHLLRLMEAAGSNAAWAPIEARQLERIGDLQQLAADYAHHSSQDRRHLQTPEQAASVEQLAQFLGDGD